MPGYRRRNGTPRDVQKAFVLTRPIPGAPRSAAPRAKPSEVPEATNKEAHGAMNKERHVCARRRVGEPAVSEAFDVASGRQSVSAQCLRGES
jgi:hypothetical protein